MITAGVMVLLALHAISLSVSEAKAGGSMLESGLGNQNQQV